VAPIDPHPRGIQLQTSLRLAVLPDESSVLPRDRFVSADTAARSIRPGQNVFVGTGCAEPSRLMHALEWCQAPRTSN